MHASTQNEIQDEINSSQNSIKRNSIFFTFRLLLFILISALAYIVVDSYNTYKNISQKMSENYIELQQDIVKSRVNDVVYIINSAMANSESEVKLRISDRVIQANNMASAIYDKYHNIEPEEKVKERIKDSLRPHRWNNGRSYIWIVDYDNNAVLSPGNPRLDGTSLKDFKDMKGNFVVQQQTKTAKLYGEGFNKDYFTKFDKPLNTIYPQISFVKDFKHYNWYIGSAEFIDDYQDFLRNELLKRVAGIRYDNNYIFINDMKGNALLSNGVMLEKPKNILELIDKNGVKIVQQELALAKNNTNGGCMNYIWHEASTNQYVSKMAFVRYIESLDWMIGTSIPTNLMDEQLDLLAKDFQKQALGKMLFVLLFFLVVLALAYYGIKLQYKKLDEILSKTKIELLKTYSKLNDLNKNLQALVQDEVAKNREKDAAFMRQSRQAAMGEMISNIAHQWRQPLNALAINVQDIKVASYTGELDSKYIEEVVSKSMEQISYMSKTIDDFRFFFKPSTNETPFSVSKTTMKALELLAGSLKAHNIELDTQLQDDCNIIGNENDLMQVVLNIINNSKDAFISNKIKNPKVTISVAKNNDGILLNIQDNAGGIPNEILDKIFDPYFTTKDKDKGTGIGLYMSKIIIEKNIHGSIRAYNADSGAVFEILFANTK